MKDANQESKSKLSGKLRRNLKRNMRRGGFFVVFTVIFISFQNCSRNIASTQRAGGEDVGIVQGTSTGNPTITGEAEINLAPFTAIDQLILCIEEIEFHSFAINPPTQGPPNGGPPNGRQPPKFKLKFEQEAIFDQAGTNMGIFDLPEGTYEQIDFKVEDKCDTDRSVSVTNANGTFVSTEEVTLSFTGSINIGPSGGFNMNFGPIADALANVASDDDISAAFIEQGSMSDVDDDD